MKEYKVVPCNGERTRHGEILFKIFAKNGCCKNIPFILVKNDDFGYACECECGMWNTSAYQDPISPVLEYLRMSGVKL